MLHRDSLEPGAGQGLNTGMQRDSKVHRGGLSLPLHLPSKESAAGKLWNLQAEMSANVL